MAEITPIVRDCGTMPYLLDQIDQEPLLAMAQESFEMFGMRRFGATDRRTVIPLIPVWFHVLWHNEVENISDEQIFTQVDMWNECFRAVNDDRFVETPSVFQPLIGDPLMHFDLAGITRTYTDNESFSLYSDNAKFTALGGHDVVDSSRYLNYWVIPLLDEHFGGYSTFPYGPANVDGIVMLHTQTGAGGTADYPHYDMGRTAVHEMGHYFNLHHIWGDEDGCTGSDFVADTPNQATLNRNHPDFPHITCDNGPNGDLFMNYMDYTYDDVTVMFSQGQCDRMDLALKNGRPLLMDRTSQTIPAPLATGTVTPTTGLNLSRPILSDMSLGRLPIEPDRRFS